MPIKRKPNFEKFTDVNGNRRIRIRAKGRNQSFSVQTNNDQLRLTHCIDLIDANYDELLKMIKEVAKYIKRYGAQRQVNIMYDVCLEQGINWKTI